MNGTPRTFFSDGFRRVGDLYAPDVLRPDKRRADIFAQGARLGCATVQSIPSDPCPQPYMGET